VIGEAVIRGGVDDISDKPLHSGRHNEEVQLCAFDCSQRMATI
jgi:hypothetical protein